MKPRARPARAAQIARPTISPVGVEVVDPPM